MHLSHLESLKNKFTFSRILSGFGLFSSDSFKKDIEQLTGLKPSSTELYKKAFTHRSVKQDYGFQNERLEFLGDAVLGMAAAQVVFNRYPSAKEGQLTEMRAKVVNRNFLNSVGQKLDLQSFLRFDDRIKSRLKRSSVLGNTLEALIGAIYLDLGYRASYRFIENRILKEINWDEVENNPLSYKSHLLEWGQMEGKEIEYIVEDISASNAKEPLFHCRVEINGVVQGEGKGRNKKTAESAASEKAIEKLSI